jgi:hypothetical protein
MTKDRFISTPKKQTPVDCSTGAGTPRQLFLALAS